MKRFFVATTLAALVCLGLAGTAGTCRNAHPTAGTGTPGAPVAGRVYRVDPGPWRSVPLTRDLTVFPAAALAAEQDRKDVLDDLVRRGVVTVVEPNTEVRVAGPAREEWMSIVSPIAGEFVGLAGCVPNSWLRSDPESAGEEATIPM